ncbi:TetR/AcrR family transcriptional regulator C-terminal domain-containing protein [Companilactobacillus sp. DQM5]|uniref:TetR/AcrR family transcriptional regulator C-terminal domain-containing protein n=1 Tax=Companilactobacillus sp. DQM5 TaxID=3463359 RepID=UPI00405A35F6
MKNTKLKLSNALKEMMETQSIDHITVNQLSEFANVSRNTFYYHFIDIHDALSWTYNHEVIEQLDNYQNQQYWKDGIKLVLDYIEENQKFCLNTFRSLNRDLLNHFLYEHLFSMVVEVVDEINDECSEQLRDEIGNFYSWAIVAQIVQWLVTNLTESKEEFLNRMYTMLHTTIAHVIEYNMNLDK